MYKPHPGVPGPLDGIRVLDLTLAQLDTAAHIPGKQTAEILATCGYSAEEA